MKKFILAALLVIHGAALFAQQNKQETLMVQQNKIIQTKLDNGLTVLVCPRTDASVVSIQLWYNVGSKHEKSGEHGIAHFIEHMIFKGTEKISESDIPLVASKLSGYLNACTWHDYTAYFFDIPVENWDKVLPIMADCMSNCTLRQDHLNSELKAVIQELKMCKDQYLRNLREIMISNIFESHPYHYSTIGFKQDLWTISRESLLAFYKKYYTPDNAVMVVVGNVDPADVHQKVEKEFGTIPAGKQGWNDQQFYTNEDIKTKTVTLYRDVQQSQCQLAYVLPGICNKNSFELEALSFALAQGKGSRLHKLLVDELQLVVDVHAVAYPMFDHAMFFIGFHPKDEANIDYIVDFIQKEIDIIAQGGLTDKEILRAQKTALISYQKMIQSTQQHAYMIGSNYLAHKDLLFTCNYGDMSVESLGHKLQELTANYCSQITRHLGIVRPIPQANVHMLNALQKKSDEEDTLFLHAKERTTPIEGAKYALTVAVNERQGCVYPHAQAATLDNGCQVVWFETQASDLVEGQLVFVSDSFYDAQDKQGLAFVVSKMLLEGTKNYPGSLFCDELDVYGMTMSVVPGAISFTCLKQDIEKAVALVVEMLTQALLSEQALEKIKKQVLVESTMFWDTPTAYSIEFARKAVYKDHPYQKTMLGSAETIQAITLEDCVDWYKNMLSPQGAYLAIVGDFENKNMCNIINQTMRAWQGCPVQKLQCPLLEPVQKQTIISPINRDQIVLMFAGLSVDRMHQDFNKIMLFDQILTGGSLRGMDNRLFKLRMQSGLFYTIGGSLFYGANEEPGMIVIKTIVSNDRMQEAEKAILQVLDEAIDTISPEELQGAKRSVIKSFDMKYESNENKAQTFLFLKKYNLPADYFAQQADLIEKITIEEVQKAVRKILSSDKLAVIKIGRVNE